MVQIRCLGRFETKSEAFACPNIPQQTVFFFQISFPNGEWVGLPFPSAKATS
jgi:hypothetical protein